MPCSVAKVCLWFAACLGMLSIGVAAHGAEENARVFRAGAAVADITPPLGEEIVGGFAPFPATAIHDPLHARALVLDDGRTRIAFVICDSLGIPREVFDAARQELAGDALLPADQILMAATHTHSATRAQKPKYRPILVRGIVSAVRRAVGNLQPARIGFGAIDEPAEVFNRRWFVRDRELLKNPFGQYDQVRMNPPRGNAALVEPAGPIDPEIAFISVQSSDGKPLALLANYSLHYVGGVQRGDVSADYFAIFARRVGELLGAEKDARGESAFVGILSNGTSGDINNINFRQRGRRYERYEKMTEVAERVAQRVKQAHARVKFHDWVPLGSARRDITLKYRKPDKAMQEYFAQRLALPDDAEKFHRYERNYAARVQRLLDGPDEVRIPLQAVRLGELAVTAIPFEVFAEIGLEIKQKSPFRQTFTIELANSSHGYLPTPRQHKLGGYETWLGTCRVQRDASEKITQTLFELLDELHADPPAGKPRP